MARRLPTFFPSISNDKRTWFWKNNLHSEGLLISIDVLEKISGLKNSKHDHINLILGFDGMVILDNGAFGSFIPIDPLLLFSKQANLKPAIAIALDSIPSSSFQEMESVKITVKNAKRISKMNSGKIKLMAVVQGNSIEAINYCAEKLNKLNFKFIGIPLSSYSKKRQYESAVLKVIAIRKNFPSNVTFHALGCGSRTLIAILTYFGVRFFDSSSFYKVAMIDAFYDNEEFCSINRPNSKAECKFCLQKQRKHKSYKQKIKYNLIEVQKEIQRCRCALEANLMREYLLDYRLNKSTANKISYLLTSENHS